MIKYVIQCETGLQGSSYYDTKSAAGQAAKWRELCTGLQWFVREVIINNIEREYRIESTIDLDDWSDY